MNSRVRDTVLWAGAFLLALLVCAAFAETVKADVSVAPNGCEVVLQRDGADSVMVVYTDGSDIYDEYPLDYPGAVLDVLEQAGVVYPAGDYLAVWSDGVTEPFTITCPDDYSPGGVYGDEPPVDPADEAPAYEGDPPPVVESVNGPVRV
jgi:hypothetical protein